VQAFSDRGEAYFISVIHAHSHAGSFEVKHIQGHWFRAILWRENQLEFPRARDNVICRAVLKELSWVRSMYELYSHTWSPKA
jgi:hypothetical protein